MDESKTCAHNWQMRSAGSKTAICTLCGERRGLYDFIRINEALHADLNTCIAWMHNHDEVIKNLQAQLATNEAQTCAWKEDNDGEWETSCGMTWDFTEDGPEENGLIYCPKCGKKAVFERFADEPEEVQ
jgi:hypothetical protein